MEFQPVAFEIQNTFGRKRGQIQFAKKRLGEIALAIATPPQPQEIPNDASVRERLRLRHENRKSRDSFDNPEEAIKREGILNKIGSSFIRLTEKLSILERVESGEEVEIFKEDECAYQQKPGVYAELYQEQLADIKLFLRQEANIELDRLKPSSDRQLEEKRVNSLVAESLDKGSIQSWQYDRIMSLPIRVSEDIASETANLPREKTMEEILSGGELLWEERDGVVTVNGHILRFQFGVLAAQAARYIGFIPPEDERRLYDPVVRNTEGLQKAKGRVSGDIRRFLHLSSTQHANRLLRDIEMRCKEQLESSGGLILKNDFYTWFFTEIDPNLVKQLPLESTASGNQDTLAGSTDVSHENLRIAEIPVAESRLNAIKVLISDQIQFESFSKAIGKTRSGREHTWSQSTEAIRVAVERLRVRAREKVMTEEETAVFEEIRRFMDINDLKLFRDFCSYAAETLAGVYKTRGENSEKPNIMVPMADKEKVAPEPIRPTLDELKVIFTSQSEVDILQTLFENMDEGIHVQELARRSGREINQVRRELNRLREAGLVHYEEEGNKHVYFLIQGTPLFDSMSRMFPATH